MPPTDKLTRAEYNKLYYEKNKNKYKCEHQRQRKTCKDCGGSQICEHQRERNRCKECGGASICEHQRNRSHCKECGGSQVCEHQRNRSQCKECGGSQVCEHQRIRSSCKECGGGGICEHQRIRSRCKECGGGGICEHQRERSKCKECGGSQVCEHQRLRNNCKECGGSSICEHQRIRSQCKECNLLNCLVNLQRKSLKRLLNSSNIEKTKPSIEYLGCDALYFKSFIEKKMKEGMTWDNIHLDHIKPVSVFNLENHDEFLDCCNYTNFQPLLANDNLVKSNKWNNEDELFWNENIKGKEYLQLYIPK